MSLEYTVRNRIHEIENSSNHEEQLIRILEVYMDLFPVLDSYFIRYSPLGFLGEGIISIDSDGLKNIREERDDVRSLPAIFSAISERKATFCSGVEYFKQTNSRYIFPSSYNSLVVVPIFINTVVIGYICSVEVESIDMFDDEMLTSLTLYGELVGKAICTNSLENTSILSKREIDVMNRIIRGESSKEMADVLKISELTVKQYVKSSIKKLGVQNRSQAIAELFRKGILS